MVVVMASKKVGELERIMAELSVKMTDCMKVAMMDTYSDAKSAILMALM